MLPARCQNAGGGGPCFYSPQRKLGSGWGFWAEVLTWRVACRVCPDDGEVQAALLGVEQARPAAPIGPDLGPVGSIWVGAGRLRLRNAAFRGAEDELVMGMASTTPCVQRSRAVWSGVLLLLHPVCYYL